MLTLGVSSTNNDPEREWMRLVSSLRSVDVEYMSREMRDAVLWKLRSSSDGSWLFDVEVEEYRPVEI